MGPGEAPTPGTLPGGGSLRCWEPPDPSLLLVCCLNTAAGVTPPPQIPLLALGAAHLSFLKCRLAAPRGLPRPAPQCPGHPVLSSRPPEEALLSLSETQFPLWGRAVLGTSWEDTWGPVSRAVLTCSMLRQRCPCRSPQFPLLEPGAPLLRIPPLWALGPPPSASPHWECRRQLLPAPCRPRALSGVASVFRTLPAVRLMAAMGSGPQRGLAGDV